MFGKQLMVMLIRIMLQRCQSLKVRFQQWYWNQEESCISIRVDSTEHGIHSHPGDVCAFPKEAFQRWSCLWWQLIDQTSSLAIVLYNDLFTSMFEFKIDLFKAERCWRYEGHYPIKGANFSEIFASKCFAAMSCLGRICQAVLSAMTIRKWMELSMYVCWRVNMFNDLCTWKGWLIWGH